MPELFLTRKTNVLTFREAPGVNSVEMALRSVFVFRLGRVAKGVVCEDFSSFDACRPPGRRSSRNFARFECAGGRPFYGARR